MLSDMELHYRAQCGDLAAAAELAQRQVEYTATNARRWQREYELSQMDTRPVKRVYMSEGNDNRRKEG